MLPVVKDASEYCVKQAYLSPVAFDVRRWSLFYQGVNASLVWDTVNRDAQYGFFQPVLITNNDLYLRVSNDTDNRQQFHIFVFSNSVHNL